MTTRYNIRTPRFSDEMRGVRSCGVVLTSISVVGRIAEVNYWTVMVKGALPLNGVGMVVSKTQTVKVQVPAVPAAGVPPNSPVVLFNCSPVGGQLAAFDVDQLL